MKENKKPIRPDRVTADLERRTFMKALFASGICLSPLIRIARAESAPPKRLAAFFWAHGAPKSDLGSVFPSSAGPITQVPVCLTPLVGTGGQKNWIPETNLVATDLSSSAIGHQGPSIALTGAARASYANASVDYVIAKRLEGQTRVGQMHVAVWDQDGTDKKEGYRLMSSSGSGGGITPETDPRREMARHFGGGSNPPPTDLASRRAVFERVRGDLNNLLRYLRSETGPYQRTQAHLASVERIIATLNSGGGGGGSCPTADRIAVANGSFPQAIKTFLDIQVAAFACDSTRVGLSIWGGGQSNIDHGSFIPGAGGAFHESISHSGGQPHVKIFQWYVAQVRYFLDELAKIREGSGTLADSVLVWTTSDMKHGDHAHDGVPNLLIGKLQNHFQTGKYINASTTLHNKLLVSIAQALGVNVNSFGTGGGSGPLPGL